MRIFSIIILYVFFLLFFPGTAFAYHNSFQPFYDWGPWYTSSKQQVLAVSTTSGEGKIEPVSPDTLKKADVKDTTGILPDNPLYFIKSLTENVGLFFTFDSIGKMEKNLAIAEERLSEVKTLLARGYYSSAGKTLDSYSSTIVDIAESLATSNESTSIRENLAKTVEQEMAKQSLFLEKVELLADKQITVPLGQAVSESKRAMDASADALNLDPLPPDLEDRIESLNAIGVISDAEASALFAIDSRSDARQRIENLVKEQVFPPSDLKRLDEAQLGYYPDDYYALMEVEKIYEFKALLENVPDESVKKQLADFGSDYEAGGQIPSDLKTWWLREQRLQELQFTLRPDLFINSIIPKDAEEYKAIENLVDSFRPTTQQLLKVDTWAKENPNKTPPPEIARTVGLAQHLGTPVPWTPPANMGEAPKAEGGLYHPYCLNNATKAKNAITGEIKTFPTTCLPPNWYVAPSEDLYSNPLTSSSVNTVAPHVATPECGYGVCKVYRCEWGWRDIDGNFRNGCEARDPFPGPTPTTIPHQTIPLGNPPISTPGVPVPDSAGNVYVNTVAPHVALPSCGFGVCTVQTCEAGWYDKNGQFSDGCESQTPPSYATPSYGTPSGTSSYQTPYGTPAYGTPAYGTPPYETPPYGSPTEVNTSAPHVAVSSCGYGVCTVQTCEAGWYDKNGQFSDGCESNTP